MCLRMITIHLYWSENDLYPERTLGVFSCQQKTKRIRIMTTFKCKVCPEKVQPLLIQGEQFV